MLFRSAAVRILPVLCTIILAAGAAFAQKKSDAAAAVFAPEPAQNAQTDPESFVNYRLYLGEHLWIQPHVFVCGQIGSYETWNTNRGQTEADSYWSKSFLLRNARVSLDAQLTKYFTAFYQSDDLNINAQYRNGIIRSYERKSNSAYVKDAYLHFNPAKLFQIYAGLLTVPTNRANLTSDTGLLGTDLTAVRTEFGYLSNSGRDTGIMVRGILLKSIIEYRVGVFRGLGKETYTDNKDTTVTTDDITRVRNKHNYPRVAARIQFSAMDGEEGYFYSENYLLKRSIFGVGLGVDYQPDVYRGNDNYIAWSIDAPLNMPISAMMVITGQINVCYAQNYPDETAVMYDGFFNLNFQGGLLIADTWEPVAKYTYTKLSGVNREYKTLTVGGNYYIDGNRLNVKSSLSLPIGRNKHYQDEWKGVLQCQAYL
jgi:hypothetical protein